MRNCLMSPDVENFNLVRFYAKQNKRTQPLMEKDAAFLYVIRCETVSNISMSSTCNVS